jgi:hypothetical protein
MGRAEFAWYSFFCLRDVIDVQEEVVPVLEADAAIPQLLIEPLSSVHADANGGEW